MIIDNISNMINNIIIFIAYNVDNMSFFFFSEIAKLNSQIAEYVKILETEENPNEIAMYRSFLTISVERMVALQCLMGRYSQALQAVDDMLKTTTITYEPMFSFERKIREHMGLTDPYEIWLHAAALRELREKYRAIEKVKRAG